MLKLLLVEDDVALGAGLQAALTDAGFDVQWVTDGLQALQRVQEASFQVMVLDITLPGLDGVSLLQRLRADGNKLPVLMLTARDTTRDKVQCFDAGADDFLVKTTDMEELIARLRALIRRSGHVGHLQVGDLTLDVDTQSVLLAGELLNVSGSEFKVLRVLMEEAGQVVSRSRLELALFGPKRNGESNVLEVHVHHLRQKIGDVRLKTVRGVGYTIARSEK